ncbi:MAG: 5'-3' exonuclease [Paraclostridium sp.]
MKRIVILDTSAIMYRAYYANMNLTNSNGLPTGAVYGFMKTINAIHRALDFDCILACQDVKSSELERTKLLESYKGDRKGPPEDLITQIPYIEELLDALGVKRYKVPGQEADDVIASLTKKLECDNRIYIITGDKDLSQLVNNNVSVCLLGKGEADTGYLKIISTVTDVIDQLGVSPDKISDLFGLIGDKADCIPGVRKIGEKKAVALLKEYGDLEGIYNNIDNINIPGIGKNILSMMKEDKDMAFLSRDLAKLNIIEDIEIDLDMKADSNKLRELCEVLEIRI